MPFLDHFGLLAPYYEKFIPLQNSEQLVRFADLPVNGALLDAGGGTGRVAKALGGLAGYIIVADLSLKMLRQVNHQVVSQDRLQAINSHTECLPFPPATFERVIMVDALHHVCDQPETALELWRVVKPGGRIVIEEPDIRKLSVKFVALFEKLALMRSHFLSPHKIAQLFQFPDARIQIEQDGFNSWVIIEKH